MRIILATRAKVGASGEPSFATTLPVQPYVAGMGHDHFRVLLSCFDLQDVETQHLPRQRLIHHACDDLLTIRCDLAIINLSIVAIRDPNDNS